MNRTAIIKALNIDATLHAKAFDLFTEIDSAQLRISERVMKLGFESRAAARPYVMAWAAEKYGLRIVDGKRGPTFHEKDRNSDGERAMYRVLGTCFPEEQSVFANAKGSATTDPVAKILKAYEKLTGAQKRSFKAQIAKL
jgi:hypothetical protein